jgi:hypothetical protein
MPDKPILIFPAATVAMRQSAGGGAPGPTPRPSKDTQGQRLSARFQALEAEFGTVQMTANGVDPEQVIVLETIGSVADFQNVVRKIAGMEWLGDFDAEVVAGDPGFLADGADPADVKARLFVLATNRTAYNEVLNLWNQWLQARDDKLPRGYGKLADAFRYLNDVRPWGSQDRVLATGVVAYWQKGLAANDPTIRFETELWCRAEPTRRSAAFERLRDIVSGFGGKCIKQAAIPEIDYHGVLVDLPAAVVRQAVDAINVGDDTQLLRLTDVKYFAPIGQASIAPIDEGTPVVPPDRPLPTGDPVVAILDGLPLANHAALQGRLVIDDPDDVAEHYRAGEHRHGTAMASLVAHDEYDSAEAAIHSKIYVRPVMQPGPPDVNNRRWETFPPNEIPVDLLHRAVRRMFEADGATPPQANGVKIINLSLGDASQPFDRHVSPWARLLDWLAWKYRVLFVVSAGNHLDDLTIPAPPAAIAGMSDVDMRSHALRAMAHQRMQRRLLAPAESINALTVGALHSQIAPNGTTGALVDLFRGAALPSPVSSVASGCRRAVKPEILVPGGRRHYMPRLQTGVPSSAEFQISPVAAQPGQLVAACHPAGLSNQYAARVSGTSNAAALTTRRAAQLIEHIIQLRAESGGDVLADAQIAVIVKAMLVHGASWADWYSFFDQVFDGPDNGLERWWRIKRACAQFLGYGPADFERSTVCNDQRVIVLGCGELSVDKAHVYNVPLPPILGAQTVLRRLTITLSWLTPINPRHRSYRVADLWFYPPLSHLKVKRRDADHDAVTRGTVQHEVLEGEAAVPITTGDVMPVQVNCRADAATMLSQPIPYALMVSIETAQPLAVSIYDQVKVALDALRAPVAVQPTAASRRPAT